MAIATLTDLTIKNLKPADRGQTICVDKSLKGSGVRLTEKGARSFVLTYGKDRKRVKIGDVGIISLAKARDKAKHILADRILNPNVPTMTFDEALTLFVEMRCKEQDKQSTYKETSRLLNRHFLPKLTGRKLSDISTQEIAAKIDRLLPTPSEANHAFTAVRTFFRWSLSRRYLPNDPLGSLRKPAKVVSRERVLNDAELCSVLATAQEGALTDG